MAEGATATVEVEASTLSGEGRALRVHAIQTGSNVGNLTFTRAGLRMSSNLRRYEAFEFPVYCFVVDHPEGLIAIDTGSSARVEVSRVQHRLMSLPPLPRTSAEQEVGPRLREAGLDPGEVRRVVLTHLDWDHAGGISHFPDAEILVNRPEYEFATTKLLGKLRYQTKLWPDWFEPTLYDLETEAYGPFPESRVVTEAGDVRLVPLPGHTVGQVGVVVETGDSPLLFVGDHVLRQDWFVEDLARDDLRGLAMYPKPAAQTSIRLRRFLQDRPSVFLPAHDDEAPARLADRERLEL